MNFPQQISRILIISDAWHPQVNGVVKTLENTVRSLKAMGLHVAMITPDLFRTLPCPGYPEIRLAMASPARLEQMIRESRPDAIHIATEGPLGWIARSIAIRQGWRFTTAYHTRFPEYLGARTGLPVGWFSALIKRFHRPSQAILVPSNALIRELRQQGYERLRHWTRGVDHAIFFPRVNKHRDARSPVFLYAGRLSVEKNISAFLDLDLPGEKWVAGDGPQAAELRTRYPEVRFIGRLSQHELADIYSRADVFVFPSKTDTFGLVLVEAMACGLPVAAYPVAGPLDVIGDSGAGVMTRDLRKACLRALFIKSDAALARAKDFTWQQATQQFMNAIVPIHTNPLSQQDHDGHVSLKHADYPARGT